MIIKEYFKPDSLREAYKIVKDKRGVVIGGGAFSHLQDREIENAVDLSKLKLSYIKEEEEEIKIGAYTTLREIEINELLKENFDDLLPKTASVIMGVQIRNMATVGGTVYGRYGFSDFLTSLLALDTYVELYKGGRISLENFLGSKLPVDILTKIIIKKNKAKALYLNMRNTSTDFSILNAAVSKTEGGFRISVGARPFPAVLAKEAMDFINSVDLNEENAAKAGQIAAENMNFGSDIRASSEYRKELCRVMVKRGILGVI